MSDPHSSTGPLAGLRVVELGELVAAPYCAKLLGDLGAEVIKIETPAGDPARERGPFPDDLPHPERSALFLYLNTSKRSVVLELESEQGELLFRRLVQRADILVEDRVPGALAKMGLGYSELAAENPGLIVTSITPFGQTGPNRAHKSEHLNLYHSAGHATPFEVADPRAARAPARAGSYLGEYDAGLTAALGTLAAVLGRPPGGRGQHVDISKQEAMMCLERVTIGRFANEPDPFSGRGPGGLGKASDGHFMVTTLEKHQWEGLVVAMGRPAWTAEPWCQDPIQRQQRVEEIRQRIDDWASTRTRDEVYHAAQAEGTPCGPVRNVAEVMAWNQAREREFFRDLAHPAVGSYTTPTTPCHFSQTPWVGRAAPLLGEHNSDFDALLLGAGREPDKERDPTRAAADLPDSGARRTRGAAGDPAAAERDGPLAGIRVADFTWAWAGPQGSLLLAMLGAEVVKIESQARLDHSRLHSLTAGSIAGGIDESPIFNDLNLGKLSLTLNLKKPEARELVKQLVAKSDVVLQNMRAGVLDRLGLGYEDLRAVNPDIIMLSSSAVGATGPESGYAGYAPTFACLSGIVSVSGHPDEPPITLSGSVDLRVGTASAFAVLAALIHRKRTGQGQNLDLSSTEVMSSMMGEAFVAHSLSGRIAERIGNRHDTMAPHGCYRCRGEGEWITIAIASESAWQAFKSVARDPQLEHEAFATMAGRHARQDDLDPIVERFTRTLDAREAIDALQQRGVAAARVHNGSTLATDPHLTERGVYDEVLHPLLGTLKTVRPPWQLEGARVRGPAPLIGEHNNYVLGEILGLDEEEIRRFVQDQIVY